MTTENIKFKAAGKRKWILAAVVLISVVVYFGVRRYFAGHESTDNAQIDGHIHPIAARVFGQITAVNVRDNALVAAGSPLVEIDRNDYLAALDKAKAELAAAVAAAEAAGTQIPMTSVITSSRVNLAYAGIETAEAARDTAVKDVEASLARLKLIEAQARQALAIRIKADQDLERMQLLVAKDEVSRQQYDSAVSAAGAAQAAHEAAEAGIAEVSRSVEAARGRVQQAEARIKEARANQQASLTGPEQMAISRANMQAAEARVKLAEAMLEQAELNLSYTRITAPIDGFISQRKVETGQMVQAGQPLLSIVPLHNIWITANYKENQMENIQPGQKAVISVDAYGGQKFNGHVDSIAAATGARFSLLPPENATGNYVKVVQRVPVKIVIDDVIDMKYPLRPGLSVISTVYTNSTAESN